jgi:hypothetical protein
MVGQLFWLWADICCLFISDLGKIEREHQLTIRQLIDAAVQF